MSGGCGGEDFDLWRGLQRMRAQTGAASLADADRMRRADSREETLGRLMALAVAVAAYIIVAVF